MKDRAIGAVDGRGTAGPFFVRLADDDQQDRTAKLHDHADYRHQHHHRSLPSRHRLILPNRLQSVLLATGRLDILHNNVGIAILQGIRDVTEAEWDRVMAVNLKSIVFATQAALPHFEANGGGSIINISSIAAMRAYGRLTAYQTTKAGIIGLTISLAGELANKRIRVNAIAPGQVWTPAMAAVADAAMSPSLREERRRSGLLQDEGTAWDVAWGAVYLASDEARWVTGHVLVIDAGVTLTMRGGTT